MLRVLVLCALLPTLLAADAREASPRSTEAALGGVPYLVSVWKEWVGLDNTTHTTFDCAGALVHAEYVLTSLECALSVTRGDGRVLTAGGHLSSEEIAGIEFHAMVGKIAHEDYDMFTHANNIALIKVSPPFVESENIKIVPVRSTLPAQDTACTISGWREDYFVTSKVLKVDQVRVLAKTDCKTMWEEDATFPMQLCAGIPKSEKPVCNVGDEGGPLVCDGALAGLYADNFQAVCISGAPNPYLDTAYFSEWIATNIAQGIVTTTASTEASTATTTTSDPDEGETSSDATSSSEGAITATTTDHPTGTIDIGGASQITASLVPLLVLAATCLLRV